MFGGNEAKMPISIFVSENKNNGNERLRFCLYCFPDILLKTEFPDTMFIFVVIYF